MYMCVHVHVHVDSAEGQSKARQLHYVSTISFQVNAVFVNIFGGIVRCDEIARGIIAAAQEINMRVPIVVRLQGLCVYTSIIYM